MKSNLKKVIISVSLCLGILSFSVAESKNINVPYTGSKKLTVDVDKYYQEAFYDYGTIRPGDNARITAKSKGSSNNYAEIKYADYKNKSFKYNTMRTTGSDMATADYVSKIDNLEPGSYAKSTGYSYLQLSVTK